MSDFFAPRYSWGGEIQNSRRGTGPEYEGGSLGKNRHGGAKGGGPAGGSPEERGRRAWALLENGRFRDAVEEFKALLSRDPREEWKEGLARAYAGHAEALAGKGMVDEALVVWQNRSRICGKPLMEGPWFEWTRVSKSGEGDIVDWVLGAGLFSEKDPETARNLAWSLFFLPEALFARLGQCRDPLVEVCRLAREAFRHYGRGEREAAEELSGRIPSRSPYAPVRFLLRALLLLDRAPQESAEILARLPSTPLDPVVEAAKIAILPLRQRFRALEAARDVKVRRLALELLGFTEKGIDFVLEILRPEARHPQEIYKAFTRHRDLFSPEDRGLILERLLVQRGRGGIPEIPRILSDRPEWEKKKVVAQIQELSNNLMDAEKAWNEAAILLHKAEGALAGKEVGAIYRHIAHGMTGKKDTPPVSSLVPMQIYYLKKSREFDPMHRATLVLLTTWALEKSPQDIDPLLHEGLKYSPDDPELLRLRLGHFVSLKKGGECDRIARRLMVVDPQTPESRSSASIGFTVAFRESLAKGRLPKAKEAYLRIKDLGVASQLPSLAVLGVILAVAEGSPLPEDAVRYLSEKARTNYIFWLLLDLETLACEIDRKIVYKTLDKSKFRPAPPTGFALLDLASISNHLQRVYGREALKAAMEFHLAAFSKVDLSPLSPEEIGRVLEAILLLGEVKLLKSLMKKVPKAHKNHPEIVFATSKVKAALDGFLSEDNLDQLYDIIDRAEANGNDDLAKRVDAWLDQYFEGEDEEGEEEIDPESDGDDLDRLIDRLVDEFRETNAGKPLPPPPPPEIIDTIRQQYPILRARLLSGDDEVVVDMMKTILSPSEFKEMKRELGVESMGPLGLAMMKWMLEYDELLKKKRR